jgi:hypothetical protein
MLSVQDGLGGGDRLGHQRGGTAGRAGAAGPRFWSRRSLYARRSSHHVDERHRPAVMAVAILFSSAVVRPAAPLTVITAPSPVVMTHPHCDYTADARSVASFTA